MITSAKLSQQYADALTRSSHLAGIDKEDLVKNLLAHLRAKGRLKLLRSIVRALKTNFAVEALKNPVFEVASEEDRKIAHAAAIQVIDIHPEATINKSLIFGWRARVNGLLIDRSAKRSLINLYQTLIR